MLACVRNLILWLHCLNNTAYTDSEWCHEYKTAAAISETYVLLSLSNGRNYLATCCPSLFMLILLTQYGADSVPSFVLLICPSTTNVLNAMLKSAFKNLQDVMKVAMFSTNQGNQTDFKENTENVLCSEKATTDFLWALFFSNKRLECL